MIKKKMIAMLLAGGQGSRLGVLTTRVAKPAVAFGGKYNIIDFALSNCVNSGVDTVGVLTQYRPLRLNSHIGIGIPWDLDRNNGGVTVLPPYETGGDSEWYSGTANAIYQNIEYMEMYHPDYVLILSGDHIYKMDYGEMLAHHHKTKSAVTIAAMPVPWEEASRFGILVTDENGKIEAFEEKPANPSSNLASMGIYIFDWAVLKEALIALADVPGCDFGKHVIPYCFNKYPALYTFRFDGYWKDVGTLQSYWEANMGLVDIIPELNLYEEFWPIYTRAGAVSPQYMGKGASASQALVSDGCRICGRVRHSVLGSDVIVEEGAVVEDSVIMNGVHIGKNARIREAILAENVDIGEGAVIGEGEFAESRLDTRVYQSNLSVLAENTVIPPGVVIGKNTAISGCTVPEDYPEGRLLSGGYILKGGDLG